MSGLESHDNINGNDDPIGRKASRRISRLTSQQAQRKRDLDRHSQQAYRQRVKSRIKNLEDELARIKTDNGSSHHALLCKIQVLHAENRDLKVRLERIQQLAATDASISANDQSSHDLDSGPSQLQVPSSPERGSQRAEDVSIGQNGSEYNYTTLPHQGDASPVTAIQNPAKQSPSCVEHTPGEEPCAPGLSPWLPNEGDFSLLTVHQTTPPTVNVVHEFNSHVGIECVMPKHTLGTYPIEKIILDFISSRRALAARGLPKATVLGPDHPLVHGFVNPDNIKGVHPTCQTLTEILLTFRDVALPEKLAFMFVMFRTLRWQLSSSKVDYDQMPRWLRPTALQITVPHSAWIDNIPWPQMRDLLIENPEKYPYSTFSALYSPNVSVNWPYDSMDAVMEVENGMILNPIFEKHIRNLKNWHVSGSFANILPGLAETIFLY